MIKVYVGLNDADITRALKRNRNLYEHSVTEVIKHEDWDGTGYTYPDLALLKLARPVQFQMESPLGKPVLPICFPPDDMEFYEEQVYVAGYLAFRQFAISTIMNPFS